MKWDAWRKTWLVVWWSRYHPKRTTATRQLGPLLEKYLKGRDDVPTEHRVRILRLIENMTLGRNAVGYLTESLHGAGSPQAQRIQIYRQMQLAFKQGLAKQLAGIDLPDSVVDDLNEIANGYFARVFNV